MGTAEPKELTGRKVLFILLAFFGVIISVNMFLLFSAVTTFPGLETPNSYVASQEFNDKVKAQVALGWTPSVTYEDGVLELVLMDRDGELANPAGVAAKVGRPTHAGEDKQVVFERGEDSYIAYIALASGPWRIFVDATARDGTAFETRLNLVVRGQ